MINKSDAMWANATYATSPQSLFQQFDDIAINDALTVEALCPSDQDAFG